jgi:methyl-accepting chemotaxis protein
MSTEADRAAIEQMIATVPIAAYVSDENWKVTSFNEAAERLTGISSKEAVGMRLRDAFGNAIGKTGSPDHDALPKGKPILDALIKFVNSTDETVQCKLTAHPIMDKDGRFKGSYGFLDRTGSNEERYLDYLNSLPTPIMAMDKDLKVQFMNKSALAIVQKTLDKVVGRPCHEFMNTDHCKDGNCFTRKAMVEDRTFVGDAIAKLPGGNKPIRGMIGPLKDEKGSIVGAVELILDISKEVEITKEVHHLVDETLAGNLKARASTAAFEGNYKSIVLGFNETLDAVIGPMNVTADYVHRIAEGDLSTKLEAEFKGDMNKLKNNLNTCIDSIRNLVDDAGGLVEAAEKGQFDRRADASRHKGDYRKVIAGVNGTLDVITDKIFWYEQILDAVPFPISVTDMDMNITFLNQPSLDILKVKRGDMLGKQCHEWNGPICRTKNCGIVRLRAGEGRTLSDRDGRALQVDAQYIKNAKGESIGHIEVLQDTTAAIRKARYDEAEVERLARNLQLLAGGDLNLDTKVADADQYTQVNRENFRKIMENLVEAQKAIASLVNDTNELSESAVEGKLSARADVSKHKGEYAKVVQGVNDTLDAVITPLKVAAAYVDKISKGDIPSCITKEYKGDFNTIKTNLNQCIVAVNALVADADMLSSAALSGNFEARADVSKHRGDYAKVVQGVNKTLGVVVEKCHWYEEILDSLPWPLSVTDMDMKWTFVNKPVEGILNHTRKELIGQHCSNWNASICRTKNCGIECLRADKPITNFAQAGKEFQVDSAYLKSAKGDKIGHIEIVQDITAKEREAKFRASEFEKATAIMEKMAAGDLNFELKVQDADEYTQDIHGLYVNLSNSIMKVRSSVQALVDDTNTLSQAAVGGYLSTRADVARHKGEYAKVVQGVNETLDAVIGPINESMRVADAYANGDLTARIGIETQGDFTVFAQSLDKIGESLTALLREVNRSVELVSSTSQELASSAEEMNASTEQVSAAIQQISKGAQTQAQQVDETAKVMADMSNMVIQVVDKTTMAGELVREGAESAMKGKTAVDNTVQKMQEIAKVVDESAKVIEALGKRSEEIGEIVGVITGISDQTNLLALNAAIEAARAGEQGRGFAVVAEEVKNLAEDSREAAERIAKMIKEVQQETNKAVQAMQRGTRTTAEGIVMVDATGRAFQEIADTSLKSSEQAGSINALMDAQKEGAQKAAKSVDGIASIAEETASAAEESASSTEELTASMEDMTARAQSLSEMAINLKRVAGAFKIDDDHFEPEEEPFKARKVERKVLVQKAVPSKADRAKVPVKVKEALAKRGINAE